MPSRAVILSLGRVATCALLLLPATDALAKHRAAVEPDPAPDPAPAPAPVPAPEPMDADDVPIPDLEMEDTDEERRKVMEAAQTLNRVEMLNLAKRDDRQMALALLEGERAKTEAIRQRDALKLSCIQDRLARMHLTRRLAVDRLSALGRPDVQADELRMRHEFRGVEMALERISGLRQELAQCVGESLDVRFGAEADHVPTVPVADPGTNSNTPPADRPPAASTFQ